MSVYIEAVIIENVVADYLMLKTAFTITGTKINRFRMTVSVVIGTAFAVVFPLINTNVYIQTAIKFFSGVLMLCISNKFENVKNFYYNLLAFFGIVFVCGGGAYAIYGVTEVKSTDISILFVLIPIFVIVKITVGIISFIYNGKTAVQNVVDTSIKICGKTFLLKGLIDTGNCAYFKGVPVIFVDRKIIFDKGFDPMKLKEQGKIEITTVGGKTEKPVYEAEELSVKDKTAKGKIYFCFGEIENCFGYRVILSERIIGEVYEKEHQSETERVS